MVLLLARVDAAAKHRPRDPGVLSPQAVYALHTAIERVGNACVNFHGYVSDSWRLTLTGTFFKGLKRIDTPDGPVFRKESEVFTDFPDELYLRAYSAVGRCSKDLKDLGPWPAATPDFVKGVRAEAGFIRDLHRYPVQISEVEEGAVSLWPGTTLEFPAWCYLWVLKTKGVRLTDTLVVDLSTKDGTKVGQFIINLAASTGL